MKRLILEVSLKPFRDISDAGIRSVCREILRQWHLLICDAEEEIAFLLWTADGSEILDYNGDLEAEIDWARWLGIANGPWREDFKILHTWRWPYCENPPRVTYERLATVVRILKEEASSYSGKRVRVGTMFDPGPEFAESSFKYERHREISAGRTMGEGKWVNCGAVLHEDAHAYAGFPQGIPEGTTLGVFLGRQSQHFLTDLGFDYLWLSNGFGFALEAWSVTGEVFDGTAFDTANAPKVREAILKFWEDFRAECPDIPIETRGSNLSTGMDLSAHASPVREIYRGGFNLVAPVNSPWAALNGDYGLELIGWLSHIAELPEGSGVPFRFYIHDPWWLNSPWLDRYGREAHDIYLPLATCRIDAHGATTKPTSVSLLTIDDSYGKMPPLVASEVTPHIQQALRDFPDAPGLVTWIYPFDEYHEWTFGDQGRVDEVFFGDWFMRAAVNQGFPLNTAVSTLNFLSARQYRPESFADTILVSVAPEAGSAMADALIEHIEKGGRVLLYGPLRHADPRVIAMLGLAIAEPLDGEFQVGTVLIADYLRQGQHPTKLNHQSLLSAGGLEEITSGEPGHEVAWAEQGGQRRAVAVYQSHSSGQLAWVRGTLCEGIVDDEHVHLPQRQDPQQWFPAERLMRAILQKFGCEIIFHKPSLASVDPLILAARSRNGWFFSGFTTSTNIQMQWKFPEGVPVPVGCDVFLENGTGTMNLSRAWHRECRVLVNQSATSEVSCREKLQGAVDTSRRLVVTGLVDATVTFLHDTDFTSRIRFQEEPPYLGIGNDFPIESSTPHRTVAHHITGTLIISW